MDSQHAHRNPWAEKLNELQATGMPGSWESMRSLLDREMPGRPKKDRRRWFLLILLLLLLIGICHSPGSRQVAGKFSDGKDSANPVTASNQSVQARHAEHKPGETIPADSIAGDTGAAARASDPAYLAAGKNPAGGSAKEMARKKTPAFVSGGPAAGAANKHGRKSDRQKKSMRGLEPDPDSGPANPAASGEQNIPDKNTETGEPPGGDTAKSSRQPDTTRKEIKLPAPKSKPQKDSLTDARGWAFALGLNQFFAIGDQQKSNFNSDGNSGNLSDYIPVPMARYYFHRWFYLQAEAQINSPQYTKTLLAGQGVKADGLSGEPAVRSVFIKKLFYLNIPVSIHYSPVKHLFLGAGLQYSRLTNGVALFQDTRLSAGFVTNVIGRQDSTWILSKLGSFKTDSSYRELKTNEWRFLLDLNFQWNRATLGLRYNQAFSNFINVRLSYLNITQAQNRSLQVYLRYMVLDRRKKFQIPRN